MSSYSKRNSTGTTPHRSSGKKESRRRRTILHEEYDELSLKRMGADYDTSSIAAAPNGSARKMRRSSLSDLEGVEMTSCKEAEQPLNNTPATSTSSNSQQIQSSIKRTAPLELWDDIKYPNYNDDPYEFEAINRISNYTYEEPKQYTYWHYRNIVEWWEDIDPTTLRRSGSIIFVVTIVILGATLIGLAIPSDAIAILDAHSNSTALPTPKYTPIQAGQHGSVDKYSPQQLLELAEQITTSCDVNTITEEESRKMCQLLCKDQMCCFEDDKYGCKGEEMCVVYAGCESLFGSQDSISKEADNSATNLLQTADEIIAYCDEYLIDPQSADGKECVARCREHLCCFEHDEESGNCKNDKVSCEVYEGCEVLVDAKELPIRRHIFTTVDF